MPLGGDILPSRIAVSFFFRSTLVIAVAFPFGYILYYMSALDAHCHESPEAFFKNFRERKMYVVLMCTQTCITRIALLMCTGRLMQLSCGAPLQAWAAASRFKWTMVTAATALLTDLALQLTLQYRSDFCDEQPGVSKWNTIGPLCRHSSQVSTIGMVFHLLSSLFTLGLVCSLISWYSMLLPNGDIKQKGS